MRGLLIYYNNCTSVSQKRVDQHWVNAVGCIKEILWPVKYIRRHLFLLVYIRGVMKCLTPPARSTTHVQRPKSGTRRRIHATSSDPIVVLKCWGSWTFMSLSPLEPFREQEECVVRPALTPSTPAAGRESGQDHLLPFYNFHETTTP